MFEFNPAQINVTFGWTRLAVAYGEFIGLTSGSKTVSDGFLPLSLSDSEAGAVVVFREAVLAAELSAAVGAVKGHNDILAAGLAVHGFGSR
jgi:hypothetical protein